MKTDFIIAHTIEFLSQLKIDWYRYIDFKNLIDSIQNNICILINKTKR